MADTIEQITKPESAPRSESPEHVQISLAAAMTLGLAPGKFWRDAKLTCINLLQVYQDGCKANCAYCGLARERQGSDSFIRVNWPTYPLKKIIERMKDRADAHRVCISMITHKRAVADSIAMARAIRAETDIPISGLISPTIVDRDALIELKAAGVDKIGIAFDAATDEIFDEFRGPGVRGPHRWAAYWRCFRDAVDVFGRGEVGSHFIVGLGETEREMVHAFQKVRDIGGVNHLFSFYPEADTGMERRVPPPIDQYRRIQLAAEIIDRGLSSYHLFHFDNDTGRIVDFGLSRCDLDRLIDEGNAFMTRGCVGRNGAVACNRPFANSAPGPSVRNYPFQPDEADIALIREQMTGEWIDPMPVIPAGRSPKSARRNPRKKGRVYFFAPTIKHFHTDEYRNSRAPFFVPVSITGDSCALNCKFCEGSLLKGMFAAKTPEALWNLGNRLLEQGNHGILLSGGCDRNGIVPLAPFADALYRLKHELGLATAVHSKLLDEPLAHALEAADLDITMIDVVGSDRTLGEIYNMPHISVADVERTIDLGGRNNLKLAPHIVIGAHGGVWMGEDRALDMLYGRDLESLVLVLLMPLSRRDAIETPNVEWVTRFFRKARTMFPDTPLMLGCARPMGKIQKQIDEAALRAGFDGITYPFDGTVALAKEMGLKPVFSEYCCALVR